MFNQLCSPAKFYLVMSIVYYILILLQNIGSHDRFYLGSYSCSHSNPGILLLINGLSLSPREKNQQPKQLSLQIKFNR